MPEELLKNKLSSWDQGGTLNQMISPSEVPLRDVMEINNWKVHKDGKSRIKRMGYDVLDAAYASFGEPIRGVFKYTDPDGEEKIIIVTRSGITVRQDVYTWTRKYLASNPGWLGYTAGYKQLFLYQDKLCFVDARMILPGPASHYVLMVSDDGETWDEIDTDIHGTADVPSAITYADEAFILKKSAGAGTDFIIKWDGAAFTEELPSPQNGEFGTHLHKWDGKLWIMFYRGNVANGYLVYSYDGNAYSAIGNYDGDAELVRNTANNIQSGLEFRHSRFFTFNNNLYILVNVEDGSSKFCWQIWRFNATLYDRFTKVYDHTGVDDEYHGCSVYEYDGKIWVISQKFTHPAGAGTSVEPDGNDNKIYSSSDLNTWTLENGSMSLGLVCGEEIHNGQVFINTLFNWDINSYTKLWKWDSLLKDFVAEFTIATNPPWPIIPPPYGDEATGDIVTFNGDLYVGKYIEVHKRELSTNTYTTIYSSSEEIMRPVAGVTLEDGRIVLGLNENVVVEGSEVYTLGLQPPVTAPTVAVDGNIVIDATNNKIDFEETLATPLVATLVNAAYTPATLCTEIKTRLDAAGASTYTVTYETTGLFRILSDGGGGGGILNLFCYTGANVAASVWTTIGFAAVDLSGDLSYDGVLGWALTGGYQYVVTFYRAGNYPVESNPGPESTLIYPDGEKIDLSAIPVSPDPKCDTRRIYRTTSGGAKFYWLDDIDDNTTTTYEDDINDDTLLGGDEVSYDRYPPPVGKYMEVWDNRLWIAGVEEYPNFLYRTNTGTSEEMASGNFMQIKARESEIITQIIAFGDRFYTFKKSSMHRTTKMGVSSYEVELLPQNIGTDAPWSVAVCDKLLIFKSSFGIEIFNGNSCYRGPQAPSMVSDLIPVTMASINDQALEKIIGSHNFADGEYWLAICTGSNTEPDTVINLSYMKMSIALYTFPEKLTYLVSTKTKAEGLMFLTGTQEGNVYIQSSGYDDNGAAISSSFRTGWFNVAGEREAWNILRRLFLKYAIPDAMTLTVNIYSDFNKTADVALSFAGSTPTTDVALRNEIMARQDLRIPGYYVSFEFVNNEKTVGEVRVSGWDAFFRKQLWQHTVEGD